MSLNYDDIKKNTPSTQEYKLIAQHQSKIKKITLTTHEYKLIAPYQINKIILLLALTSIN
jgi:hypothetical protein